MAVRGLWLLGSISVFIPTLCVGLLVLAEAWFWFLTLGSSRGLNLGSRAGPGVGYEWSMGWWWRVWM